MTSEDGQIFYYYIQREDGTGTMLGFPHAELPNLIECAAMQMGQGRDKDGDKIATAFITDGFLVERVPKGETALSMTVGETRRLASFLLPDDMPAELAAVLMLAGTRHHRPNCTFPCHATKWRGRQLQQRRRRPGKPFQLDMADSG